MMICITMDVADEYVDPDHKLGLTEEGYERLVDALQAFGDNIDVSRGGPLVLS